MLGVGGPDVKRKKRKTVCLILVVKKHTMENNDNICKNILFASLSDLFFAKI